MISYEGKLYLKDGVRPADYKRHVMYLFSGEYIEVEKKGEIVYTGNYQSVASLQQSKLYMSVQNAPTVRVASIARNAIFKKYVITLNGQKAGEINEGEAGYPCFAHCLSRKEND